MQMLFWKTPTTSIQKFIIWENQAKQTSKKNHQLSWKSWNYYIQLIQKLELPHYHRKSPTRVPSNTQQTSANRDEEIKDLNNQIKLLQQNQKQHDTQEQPKQTEIRKNIPSQKTPKWSPPQELKRA